MSNSKVLIIVYVIIGIMIGSVIMIPIVVLGTNNLRQNLYDANYKINSLNNEISYQKQRNIELALALQVKNITYVDRIYIAQFTGRNSTEAYYLLYSDPDASKVIQWAIEHNGKIGIIQLNNLYVDLTKKPIIIGGK